jgi:menaquinone-9 beta-reductase
MTAPKPITIVGGGLAGLTLGIGLRQKNIAVEIFEAGHYPRHRVCGEFINGRGLEILATLGLKGKFLEAGAIETRNAAFFSANSKSPARPLSSSALCLSRYVMDDLLAREYQRLGGVLHENTRWQKNEFGEGVVRATGRRLQPTENGWRWFGVKAHARNVNLNADLEMHVSRAGYVGLCKLGGGEVNVCGLFRRKSVGDKSNQTGVDLLRGEPGTILNERLARADFVEDSFCSVAGLSLRAQHGADRNECSVGDSLTMIPPVTGNGMSMAFESAEIAIEPLAAFGRGQITWTQTQQTVARNCDDAFARRLKWARMLQWLMLSPLAHRGVVSVLLRSNLLWRMMFEKTR